MYCKLVSIRMLTSLLLQPGHSLSGLLSWQSHFSVFERRHRSPPYCGSATDQLGTVPFARSTIKAMTKPKPNSKCHCGTGLKYKKCCSKTDRKNKSKRPQVLLDPKTEKTSSDDPTIFSGDQTVAIFSDDPTTWKHYGERHSSYRFFIGQRVECCLGPAGTFVPGKVVKFNYMEDGMTKPAPYQILLDVGNYMEDGSNYKLIMARFDNPSLIRPLGFTKTDTCALCGVNSTTTKLSNCSACNRAQYCSGDCQRADWKEHKPICKLITEDQKRTHDDAKKQSSGTKTPQELTELLLQAVGEANKPMVKRLLKMKAGCFFDINQRGKQGDEQGNTPLTCAVGVYRLEQDLSIIKRLLKVKTIDVNKYDLVLGGTPLYHACQKGLSLGISIDDNHDELVELLKSAGAKYLRHKV